MWNVIRKHLGVKLFISYLIIVLFGAAVLMVSAEFAIPSAFEHHMGSMLGNQSMGLRMGMMDNLFVSFRNAVTEALTRAALAAGLAAVVVSIFISRRVVAPISEMQSASQRIAEGRYGERVYVPGNAGDGSLDELGQLAHSFNRMAAALEQTEEMRLQLIGDVSHELRTPLTTIQGSMEGLMDGVLPANPTTYQVVHQEAVRLKRLVDDLQELSRVEAGAFELDREPVSIPELVADAIQRLRSQFEEKNVQISAVSEGDPPLVFADRDRIVQVLLNLAGNALQYTPEGGKVTITLSQDGNFVQVTVADNGVGISPEHLPYLFTRFYRVDKSRSRVGGGSGIGLTICKYLVEAHGGRIWAESSGVGEGSTFNFTLPINPGP